MAKVGVTAAEERLDWEAAVDGRVEVIPAEVTGLGMAAAVAWLAAGVAAMGKVKKAAVVQVVVAAVLAMGFSAATVEAAVKRAALREMLIESGAFGPHLAEIDALLAALLADGSERYGCPLAPPTL